MQWNTNNQRKNEYEINTCTRLLLKKSLWNINGFWRELIDQSSKWLNHHTPQNAKFGSDIIWIRIYILLKGNTMDIYFVYMPKISVDREAKISLRYINIDRINMHISGVSSHKKYETITIWMVPRIIRGVRWCDIFCSYFDNFI